MVNLASQSADYHLTSAADGVPFDIDADGVVEQVSWTAEGTDIAFLALDWNENGQIDNGSELFGNYTLLANGQRAVNGFAALVDLDGGPSISDGKINSSDAAYARLRLWVDRNHDAKVGDGELLTLAQAKVTTIFTSYEETRRRDEHGNEYRLRGIALIQKRQRELPRRIFDVFLVRAN